MRFIATGFFIALFALGVFLFGFAFSVVEALAPWVFFAGIVLVGLAIGIPQHILGNSNNDPAAGKTGGPSAPSSY